MSTLIPQVVNTNTIRDAEFVSIDVVFTNGTQQTTRSLYFSTSYKVETISGNDYIDLQGLLSISGHQRTITSSGYDTSITLSGLSEDYIYWVAGGPAQTAIAVTNQADIPVGYYPVIKGSKIKIYRGFYNSSYALTSTVLRYTGIITSYSIAEERDSGFDALNDTYTIVLQSSSYKQVLENRVAGRKTNPKSWNYFYPDDTSMNRVPGLENKKFDFGKGV